MNYFRWWLNKNEEKEEPSFTFCLLMFIKFFIELLWDEEIRGFVLSYVTAFVFSILIISQYEVDLGQLIIGSIILAFGMTILMLFFYYPIIILTESYNQYRKEIREAKK